jgi:hypothetical protein
MRIAILIIKGTYLIAVNQVWKISRLYIGIYLYYTYFMHTAILIRIMMAVNDFECPRNADVPLSVVSLCIDIMNEKEIWSPRLTTASIYTGLKYLWFALVVCLPYSGGKVFGSTNKILCMSSECSINNHTYLWYYALRKLHAMVFIELVPQLWW